MVVTTVPEKKNELLKSQLLLLVKFFFGSRPLSLAFTIMSISSSSFSSLRHSNSSKMFSLYALTSARVDSCWGDSRAEKTNAPMTRYKMKAAMRIKSLFHFIVANYRVKNSRRKTTTGTNGCGPFKVNTVLSCVHHQHAIQQEL